MTEIGLQAMELGWEQVLTRICCAMLIGAFIGTEREFSHRPAGLRTHMLVAIGACSVMITSQMLFCQYHPYGVNADPARLSAQVIAGVGFLGAGTILREGVIVKGLTTAASIWSVACLGIAVGAGYYEVALSGFGAIIVTLTLFEWLQRHIFRNRFSLYHVSVKCTDLVSAMENLTDLIHTKDARMSNLQLEDNGDGVKTIKFVADFAGRRSQKRYEEFLTSIGRNPIYLSVTSDKNGG